MVEERRDGSDAASGVTAVTWRGEATEVEAAEVRGGPAPVRWWLEVAKKAQGRLEDEEAARGNRG